MVATASRPSLPADRASVLLARLASGERGVASELFRELWPPVRRLAGAMLPAPADAEDAAQDAMVTIFERIAGYDTTRPGLPWALAIAGFACRTTRKRRLRRRESGDDAPELLDDRSPEQALEQRELIEGATAALASLSDLDRDTLVATYWEEAAAPAGATIRKRRERALDRLRALFGRIYGLR